MKQEMTFALCFCNRGFMPGELIYEAREDMVKAMTGAGYDAAKELMEKNKTLFFHDVVHAAMLAMEEDAKKAIKIFSSTPKMT